MASDSDLEGPSAIFYAGVGFLLVCGGFLWGVQTQKNGVFPRSLLDGAANALDRANLFGSPHFLYPARHEGAGVTVSKSGRMAGGSTLVSSYWRDDGELKPEIRLLDVDGDVLHRWEVRPTEVWGSTPRKRPSARESRFDTNYAHGVELLEGGDVVFTIEYLGLVRMGPCGDVRWKVERRNHHSVERDSDGHFWTVGHRTVQSSAENDFLPALKPPFGVDTLVEIAPDGDVLREIDLLEVLIDSRYQYLLPKYGQTTLDLTHVNDVEPLPADYAEAYDFADTDDLMVSIRGLDSVLVIDLETRRVVFYFGRGLIGQHDPDFRPSGKISIFNNRVCHSTTSCSHWGENYGGSEIVMVDPRGRDVETVVGGTESTAFYTQRLGKHQYLRNGNILVNEGRAGRVFEATRDGDIVWEWVHRSYGDSVPEVAGVERYRIGEEEVESWSCSGE